MNMQDPRDINLNQSRYERLVRKSLYDSLIKAVEYCAPKDKKSIHVLDVGSGRGELLQLLTGRGYQVTGLDAATECVRAGSKFTECLKGGIKDAASFFKRNEFDIIISSHLLEHLKDPVVSLEAIKDLDAAAYVFSIPNVCRPSRIFRAIFGFSKPDHPNHIYGWARPEFEAMLLSAGFRTVKWYYDRVTINPFGGAAAGFFAVLLNPLEVKILPMIFPLLSSSFIVVCKPVARLG